MDTEIDLTADGSTTLYRPDIDEHYHSVFGAVAESSHVYVDLGFRYAAAQAESGTILDVFELGLGTGLNAVLTAMTGLPCRYTAIELYPIDDDVVSSLSFGDAVDTDLLARIHMAQWGEFVRITPTFALRKLQADFLKMNQVDKYDVIYMDAFAPEKQPELWSETAVAKLSSMLKYGGVMTTYCAKGAIRRLFEANALTAQRLPGPSGGKREVLRLINKTNS